MAHLTTSAGINLLNGALKKKQNKLSITRVKPVKDPIIGEVVGFGPKEIYIQERRDMNEHPLSDNEKRSRADWRVICREAPAIINNKSHPRYMELYHRWREHILSSNTPMQFPNFVRHVLSQE